MVHTIQDLFGQTLAMSGPTRSDPGFHFRGKRFVDTHFPPGRGRPETPALISEQTNWFYDFEISNVEMYRTTQRLRSQNTALGLAVSVWLCTWGEAKTAA